MVKIAPPVYLFIGQDSLAKEDRLKKLKVELLPEKVRDFNLDILYGKDLELKSLQERLLALPVESSQRIVLIKDAQSLRQEVRAFLKKYLLSPRSQIILILDMDTNQRQDAFASEIRPYVQVVSFLKGPSQDTFSLSRQIEQKKAHAALIILHQLLEEGEKPERIMGGLRYDWERNIPQAPQMRRRLKLLLACDLEIKTGRLKADFALEKLVVGLCGFSHAKG